MFKKKYKVLAPVPKKDGGSWWMNCGSMYEGKEPGSFNLFLDAVPTATKEGKVMFHLREWTEEDFREQRERSERRANAASSSGYSSRGTLNNDLPLQFGRPTSVGSEAHEPVPF